MSKFVTSIKTKYTSESVSAEKKGFVSAYSSKSGRKVITGANRNSGKKFASQLVK